MRNIFDQLTDEQIRHLLQLRAKNNNDLIDINIVRIVKLGRYFSNQQLDSVQGIVYTKEFAPFAEHVNLVRAMFYPDEFLYLQQECKIKF